MQDNITYNDSPANNLLESENLEEKWHKRNELANSLTHGLGCLLSIIGFFFLLQIPLAEGNSWKLLAFGVYGLSLITLYSASTLYHSFQNKRLKHIFHVMDHCAIYLLIAGSYTPFTLIPLHGFWGWTLFGIIWTLATIGIIFKILFIHRFRILSTIIYMVMGWLVLIAAEPLSANLSIQGIYWLITGGISYTIGVFFFVLDRIPFFHAIWHLFVIGGSVCHYFAICFHI